jgi:hypothetical protein
MFVCAEPNLAGLGDGRLTFPYRIMEGCPSLGRNRQFAGLARRPATSLFLFQSTAEIQIREDAVVGIHVGLTIGCNVN